jgi:hypothetical protein
VPGRESILSEVWLARHATATEPDRSNEWLDDGTRWSVERSASDGPALREEPIRALLEVASATTVVGKLVCRGPTASRVNGLRADGVRAARQSC